MITLTRVPKSPLLVQQRGLISGSVDPSQAGEEVLVAIGNKPLVPAAIVDVEGNWQIQVAFKQPGTQPLRIAIGQDQTDVTLQVLPREQFSNPPAPPPRVVNGKPESNTAQSAVAMPEASRSHEPRNDQDSGQSSGQSHDQNLMQIEHSRPAHQPSLDQLVREAHNRGYSDVHLGVGRVPHFRDRGVMAGTPYPVTDEVTFYSWLHEILPPGDIEAFRRDLDYDGAAEYDFARVRVNLMMTIKGPSLVLRLIPMTVPTLEQLKFPRVFYDICYYHQGLILITGPTGSGKSTTMAAMVHEINQNMQRHIITIEDPIEFVHTQDLKSVISQREVGIHTREFARALKASLREDPDVILIGEIRDQETIRTALKAAQTGHLVFGTLHTNSAVKTLERIFNMFEPDERDTLRIEVAESLAAIVAQGLVRTTDGRRTAIYEVLINNDTIRDYIKRDEPDEIENQLKDGSYYGMCTRNQTIYRMYETGAISEETALEASLKPSEMAILLRGGDI